MSALVEIDSGFDYRVLVVEDSWVVRIPKREQVVPAFEQEIALLPVLADALPVEVPRFELVSRRPPYAVYRMLHGTPLAGEDSEGVRRFLEALHSLRTDVLIAEDWVERFRAQCAEFDRLVVPLLDAEERRRAAELFAEAETLAGFEPCVIHADLGPEHLLVRDGRLAAVIDWGDACLGDPALDYSWLLDVFPDWDVDDELRRRARFYHRLAPFYGVHVGVFAGNDAYRDSCLEELRTRL